jgi:CDP-diacylglycerol--glycerol-3-phosphate 3-phosphatidyltransferase
MNLPNVITLSRIPLMFVIAFLMCCQWTGAATLAFVLFLAAAGGDWLDGYIARKRGLVTTFGKLMDALTDKIMVLGLVIAFVGSGEFLSSPRHEIAVGVALVTLCREFLVTGMRMVAASKGIIVAADKGGKSKTITQLIALGFLLGAPMVARDLSQGFGHDFSPVSRVAQGIGEYIFILGTVLAVWSGWRYIAQLKSVVFADSG